MAHLSNNECSCDFCGLAFKTTNQRINQAHQFCSRECCWQFRRGHNNPFYKGGYISQAGYRIIRVNGISQREHRVVMEEYLGRTLHTDETVHHINHDKLDNRIDNLQLISRSEHPSLHCINSWASQYDCCRICSTAEGRMAAYGLCNACYLRYKYNGYESPPPDRLTQQTVDEMRRLYATGSITQRALAEQFGISQQHLSEIIRGRYWS